MKLVKWDVQAIDNCYYARTKNQSILEEFINSGMECAKIEGWTNTSAAQCATSLNTTSKRMKMHGVKAISRKGEVYLIKTK